MKIACMNVDADPIVCYYAIHGLDVPEIEVILDSRILTGVLNSRIRLAMTGSVVLVSSKAIRRIFPPDMDLT